VTQSITNDHVTQPGDVIVKSVQVFPSAVDAWLIVVLYLGPAILSFLGIYLAVENRADEALMCFAISVGLVFLNLLLTRPCRYTLTADTLNLRCGVYNETIPLTRVRSVEKSRSWLSGPAMSLSRVRIRLDKGYRLVSPSSREPFMEQLMAAVKRAGGQG